MGHNNGVSAQGIESGEVCSFGVLGPLVFSPKAVMRAEAVGAAGVLCRKPRSETIVIQGRYEAGRLRVVGPCFD